MTRYYFDLDDGEGFTQDGAGVELPHREYIPKTVAQIFADIARDELPKNMNASMTIFVRGEGGSIIFTATLASDSRWL